jgi:hypothetical protein
MYKTSFGAIFSTIYMLTIFVYAILQCLQVWNNHIYAINTTTQYKDPNSPEHTLPLDDFGFKFAFGFAEPLPASIGTLDLFYKTKYWPKGGEAVKNAQKLEIGPC